MKPDPNKDFEQNVAQLIQLLKKMMKNLPQQGDSVSGKQVHFKDSTSEGINMNICFFSLFPMSSEDLDELEDLYEQYLMKDSESAESQDELSMDLTSTDVDFLKSNGISF